MKKSMLKLSTIAAFTLLFSMPLINADNDNTVERRPMFGSRTVCGPCVLGTKTCVKTTYVFWMAFEGDPFPESC